MTRCGKDELLRIFDVQKVERATEIEMPPPPPTLLVQEAIHKLYELIYIKELTCTPADLVMLKAAQAAASEVPASLCRGVLQEFFTRRRRVKRRARRHRKNRDWIKLAHALGIDLALPHQIHRAEEIDRAITLMSLPYRKDFRMLRGRAPWSSDQINFIRSVIWTHENHPQRFTRSQRVAFRQGLDCLSIVLIRGDGIDWRIAVDEMDAEDAESFPCVFA